MEDELRQIRIIVEGGKSLNHERLRNQFRNFLQNCLKGLQVDSYIGDYPTFMEPAFLGENVVIGDDALIGPRVYVGENCEIGDYVQISNSIIFENAKIGDNIKLENCIVMHNAWLLYKNDSEKNCIIDGRSFSKEHMKIIRINLE